MPYVPMGAMDIPNISFKFSKISVAEIVVDHTSHDNKYPFLQETIHIPKKSIAQVAKKIGPEKFSY